MLFSLSKIGEGYKKVDVPILRAIDCINRPRSRPLEGGDVR